MTCPHPRTALYRFELRDFVSWSCEACGLELERTCGLCGCRRQVVFPTEGLELCWQCKEALLD
jgi:hypothetical protein